MILSGCKVKRCLIGCARLVAHTEVLLTVEPLVSVVTLDKRTITPAWAGARRISRYSQALGLRHNSEVSPYGKSLLPLTFSRLFEPEMGAATCSSPSDRHVWYLLGLSSRFQSWSRPLTCQIYLNVDSYGKLSWSIMAGDPIFSSTVSTLKDANMSLPDSLAPSVQCRIESSVCRAFSLSWEIPLFR